MVSIHLLLHNMTVWQRGHIEYLLMASTLLVLLHLNASNSSISMGTELTESCFQVSNFKHKRSYIQGGDVSIGALFQMTMKESNLACGGRINPTVWHIQSSLGLKYAIDKINRDVHLLPDVQLGFAILDECGSVNTALATALSFLPVHLTDGYQAMISQDQSHTAEFDPNPSKDAFPSPDTESEVYSTTTINTNFHAVLDSQGDDPLSTGFDSQCNDVVGVIGPMRSFNAVPISYIYAVAQIPMISFTATSDDLSDRDLHPYFLRLVPPDSYQVQAMLSFIADQGWSYISVVYRGGPYGQNGFDTINLNAPKFGICIATSHKVIASTNYTIVMKDLITYSRARVVIVFAHEDTLQGLFNAAEMLGKKGHFVWVGSDAFTSTPSDLVHYKEDLNGMFVFTYFSTVVEDFNEYLETVKVANTSNPWLKEYLENFGQCSFENDSCIEIEDVLHSEGFEVFSAASLLIDSVYAYAHAIDKLLGDHCPNVTGPFAGECVQGDLLLQYLMNSDFEGVTGRIRFDANGSLLGKYRLLQFVLTDGSDSSNASSALHTTSNAHAARIQSRTVGVYDLEKDTLHYTAQIQWSHLAFVERLTAVNTTDPFFPESVCNRPCKLGELEIRTDQCCWDCRSCRKNERMSLDSMTCEPCDLLTWPDPDTEFTTCVDLPLSYPSLSEILPAFLVCLGLFVTIATISVLVAYIHLREARVIKAASRELSFIQIAAILFGDITVFLYQAPPSDFTCSAQYFFFCFSFSLLYAPMLVKAVRIFRIFQSAKTTSQKPRFVSPLSQVIKVAVLVAVQLLVCLLVFLLSPPYTAKTQPDVLEELVELYCDMTVPGLSSFLAYNLCLVALCSALAFKTRSLPDNFNESRFTSMCVSTTLVIWLAFIPTYFTATRTVVRVLLLSVALLINHTVAVIFLFLPKIYAAVYLPEEVSRTFLGTVTLRPGTSKVSPMPETSEL